MRSGERLARESASEGSAPEDTSADRSLVERLSEATELLESIVEDRALLAELSEGRQRRLLDAAGLVWCPDTTARRRLVKALAAKRRARRIAREESVLHETGIRAMRRKPNFTTPNALLPARAVSEAPASAEAVQDADENERLRPCYVCKQSYSDTHHFYDQLCPECAGFNFAKRTELADLAGRVALVTGGRVKIGYQAALKLLRCGARLVVCTRFPRDAALRYANERDFDDWSERLEIFGLDLRHVPSVETLCQELVGRGGRLDYLINNACQTVRRPPAFFEHMMVRETAALEAMPAAARKLLESYEDLRDRHGLPGAIEGTAAVSSDSTAPNAGLVAAAGLSQMALLSDDPGTATGLFPSGLLDQDQQQIDLRATNSWRMLLAEVPTVELLEVHLVNAVAPFILNARLKPLLLAAPGRDQHIVNVSAVEGQFYRTAKTTRHPHTNMAKASLNMMTRTAAADYFNDGIHMNSIDTGWITDEDPEAIAARKVAEHRFHPPLDIVDGAARIVDPIIHGANTGEHIWGQFIKDYRPANW